jgi:hypothetical protein
MADKEICRHCGVAIYWAYTGDGGRWLHALGRLGCTGAATVAEPVDLLGQLAQSLGLSGPDGSPA